MTQTMIAAPRGLDGMARRTTIRNTTAAVTMRAHRDPVNNRAGSNGTTSHLYRVVIT